MDWPNLLRAGLHGLRLRPAEFWALTPAELQVMLGLDAKLMPMARDRLAELGARLSRYPRRVKMSGLDQIDALDSEVNALERTLGDATAMTAAFDSQLRDIQGTLARQPVIWAIWSVAFLADCAVRLMAWFLTG